MDLKIILPPRFENEKEYVICTVFKHFFKIENVLVEYTSEINENEIIVKCNDHLISKKVILYNCLFKTSDQNWLSVESLPTRPLEYLSLSDLKGRFLHDSIPALYSKPGGYVIRRLDNAIICDIDILGGIFFLLTLYEEVVSNELDEHGRFNYKMSLLYGENLYHRPLVNEYLEILKALFVEASFPEIDENREYRLLVSHDVDVPFSHNAGILRFTRNIFADLLLRRSVKVFLIKLLIKFIPIQKIKCFLDPFNNFHYLMDISDKYSIKSQFNFIAVNGRGGIDGSYDISEPFFLGLFKEINRRGHSIGLHPSYYSMDDSEMLKEQFSKLKTILTKLAIQTNNLGGRQHYLRWKNPDTWQALDDLGVDSDSSIGSEYFMGFRCGTCYEFPTFNLKTGKRLNLIEFPLIVMDVCLFKCKSRDVEFKLLLEISNICKYYNGNMTFLFHNNYAVTNSQKFLYESYISKLI